MQDKKQQLVLDVEQWTSSKLEKEYIKAIYFHPAYLTYMQSTSCEILGWMKHKLEIKIARRNINNLDMRMTTYSLDELLSQFGTSLLFHVWF